MTESESDSKAGDSEQLDLNQYRAECEWCENHTVKRIYAVRSVTSEELAEEQPLYCERCDEETLHTLVEAGADGRSLDTGSDGDGEKE